ncbi:MAG: Cof-type HAD-IIB family hydrolase [Lachnospiraceae bacterium]|nr:Cof-type HAD-IIB family hydrolase [Lachnospiraceae bacterium]
MIKLIASDLDGTLVSGNMAKLPEEFPALVRELKERGILFAAASGRQYHNLRRLFAEVKDDIAYICENGALTVYQDKILHKTEIPTETASLIIRRLEEEPDTEVLVSGAFCSYINPKDPYFEQYIKDMGNEYKVIPNLTDIGEPVIKLALFEKAGTEDRERQSYWQNQFSRSESFPFDVKVVTSGSLWLDFLFPNSDKGTGIKALAGHLGLRREEILSFGDNFNDIEMFQASGISVAVENARPGIAELCDYTTPSVVEFIEEMLAASADSSAPQLRLTDTVCISGQ